MSEFMIRSASDLASYLQAYPREMAFGDEPAAAVVDRYHAPVIAFRSDGLVLDRERLVAHAKPVRRNAEAVDVDVHDALVDGDRVAARYTLTATMRGGAVVANEIVLVGRLATDGRLAAIDQLTRPAS